MGFQQGLSGLSVSSKSLDAIGNNIANSSTVGYKASQAQFADVFAAALTGGGGGQVGIGSSVPSISQLFTQGNVTTTNNPLDMAINGGGFFRLSDAGTAVYSRNGQFSLDKDGYIVNPAGLRLTGYGADETGAIVPGDLVDLRMSSTNIEPSATTSSEIVVNLDSRQEPPSSMTSGKLTGSTAPALIITGANNELDIQVDGMPTAGPVTIEVPINGYSTADELADAVEDAINSNTELAAANALVDVTVSTSGALVITSRSAGTQGSQGYGSSVVVSGGTGEADLLGAPVSTDGADNFSASSVLSYTASTAQTVYDSLGNPHNMTMYFAKTAEVNTWQLYTALNGDFTGTSAYAVTPNLTSTTGVAGTVGVSLDGVAPVNVSLAGTGGGAYGSLEELQLDLQAGLDLAFPAPAIPPTVTISGSKLYITAEGSTVELSDGTLTVAHLFGTSVSTTATLPSATLLEFDSSGTLETGMPLNLTFDPATGAEQMDFTLNLTGSSQYGIDFGVNQLLQDGFTSGRLTGISISPEGVVQGRYSNGKTRDQGQIVLVNFTNANGLQSMGGNVWGETSESGQPIPGAPGQGSLGLLQSAAVEESNVDLTAELVQMIMQQRVYQANSQTIKTQDQILQTLVNLR